MEAWGGVEPPYNGFADRCLTTWLPGRIRIKYIVLSIRYKV